MLRSPSFKKEISAMTSQARQVFIEVDPAARFALEDVLYRFAAGQDLKNRELLESAFATESELDFTQPAAALGVDIPVFSGRDAITHQIMSATADLHTTHTVTNTRITRFEGKSATLLALIEAQHLPRRDQSRHLLLKNFYFLDATIENGLWVASRVRIENVWRTGDPAVLFPASP
jgi:hypothetical protein